MSDTRGLGAVDLIIEQKVRAQPQAHLAGTRVIAEIGFLVRRRVPMLLDEDVVQRSPLAIQAHPHARYRQQFEVLQTGELAALVAVPDHGCARANARSTAA